MSGIHFLNDFSTLGILLGRWLNKEVELPLLDKAVSMAQESNPFFTPFMQRNAIEAITKEFLEEEKLKKWLSAYKKIKENRENRENKRVGIVMAGNIPLVGFHDFLAVMAVGAKAVIKLSSKDSALLPAITTLLCEINPLWSSRISFIESSERDYVQIRDADAVIATGSSTSKESFLKLFKEKPLLARGSRFSYAVVDSATNLEGIERDVFLYFGLGCRNISHFLLKDTIALQRVVAALQKGREMVEQNEAYMNNYKRIKAIYDIQGLQYRDGGFFLMVEGEQKSLPLSLLSYNFYADSVSIASFEREKIAQIQKKYTTFGLAQSPQIADYADNIDTINFLIESL